MLRKLLLNGAAHTTSSARLRLRFASEAPWREGSLPRRQEERKEAGAVVAVARKLTRKVCLLRRKAGTKTHWHAAGSWKMGSSPHAPPFGSRDCAEQMTTLLPIHRIEERSKRFRHWVSWPSPYTQARHVREAGERR
jgi:hypothetical protein